MTSLAIPLSDLLRLISLAQIESLEDNKTKVLSVQLGKTLGLTKVPITETEESNQVQKRIWFKTFFDPRERVIIKDS